MKTVNNIRRGKRGSALVEYGLIVAGVALVGAVAVSVFGNKVGTLMGMGAGLLPGDESGKVTVGKVVNHELDANGNYVLNPEGNTYEESMGITSEDLVTSPGSSSGN